MFVPELKFGVETLIFGVFQGFQATRFKDLGLRVSASPRVFEDFSFQRWKFQDFGVTAMFNP